MRATDEDDDEYDADDDVARLRPPRTHACASQEAPARTGRNTAQRRRIDDRRAVSNRIVNFQGVGEWRRTQTSVLLRLGMPPMPPPLPSRLGAHVCARRVSE